MNQEIVINLAQRYAVAFATIGIGELIAKQSKRQEDNDYDLKFYDELSVDFEDTVMDIGGERLRFGNMLTNSESVFAPPLLLSFSRKKNLIETPVSGSGNIVVERWGTSPWDIDIKGLLIDMEQHHYPAAKIEKINELFDYNDIVKVEGKQWEDKTIDSIYIKDISLSPVEGYQDTIGLSIRATSIREFGFNLE